MTDVCPLCAGGPGHPLFEKGGQRYFRCGHCGFLYGRSEVNANFQPRLGDYEPAYRQYLDATAVDEVNHDATLAWVEQHAPLGAGNSLFDVGAGSGKFLRHVAARRLCRIAGLEPSAALFEAFNLGSLGVASQTLPAFAASYEGSPFDVVTVLDVIEHVEDPVPFARALNRITMAGGLVFLSTPDAGSAVARGLGRHWHHCNRYHFSLFDPATIARLGADAGFATLEVTHRGKRFTSGYLRDYVRDFLLPGRRSAAVGQPGNRVFSLNLYDIMSVVWRRLP